MTPQAESILEIFKSTGAYLQGHFRLTSGLHSAEYLQCALVLQHPEAAEKLRRENPAYVFFSEREGDGPVGYQGAVLTAERSLAVDRAFIPLGVPIWLDAKERFIAGATRRLAVAQDTGGAIKGPVRGDLFWGSDESAASAAGAMNAMGRYYLLLPLVVAPRGSIRVGVPGARRERSAMPPGCTSSSLSGPTNLWVGGGPDVRV